MNISNLSYCHEPTVWNIYFLTFPYLPVSALCSLSIANFTPLRPLCSNSPMTSWRPLTLVKLQFLTALDMSAAFDTLDHATLLHRLEHTFGLSGFVISWICSYLTNRSSFVKIDSSSSPSTTISTGVPQGSVFGPLLLCFSYHLLPM